MIAANTKNISGAVVEKCPMPSGNKLPVCLKRVSASKALIRHFFAVVCIMFSLGIPHVAHAVSTGMQLPHDCESGGGSGPSWNRPERAETNDGQSATAGNDEDVSTEQLQCRDYRFAIPAGATINGITVTIRRGSSDDADDRARDAQVQIFKTTVPTSVGKAATNTNYPDSLQIASYGSSSDLWGLNWTPADINSAQFGLTFRARLRDNDDTVSVDYIGITVEYTLPDTTAPAVTSIKRVDFNPTNKPSVQWTVTFSEDVTGVNESDFLLVNTNLAGTPAITDVSGSGSVYTVTATTGSGGSDGQLGLNLVDNNSIQDTSSAKNPLGGNAPNDGNFTGEKYDISTRAPSACFGDDFNRSTLGTGDWQVANSSGNFTPAIQGNRLRLTPATGSISTTASLLRSFPGAGNMIVVEFDYFAYGGTGADGIAVTLSDASVSPVPGAFGGSLGYAQKNNQQDGCTQGSGCPGFAGGWLGVGIDEFGYFARGLEGRSGGGGSTQTANDRPNVVTVRGSGSGQDGYAWHASSPTLNPGTDITGNTAGPAHHYRITVNHSDNVHAYVQVERDAKDGNGMQTIIPQYDAKLKQNQVAVPKNWLLSFTGSTGGFDNNHEIDSLSVCATQPITPIALHHIRLEYPSRTCTAGTVIVKACANADCSVLYPAPVSLSLTRQNTNGGTNIANWPNNTNGTYRFADNNGNAPSILNGEAQVALTTTGNTRTGNVTLGVNTISPAPAQPTEFFSDGAVVSNGVMNFATACFAAVESGNDPATPIYTKLVNTNFTLRVLATKSGSVNSSYNTNSCGFFCTPDPQVAVTLVDPTANSGNCGDGIAGLVNTQTIPITSGVGSVTFSSPNAAKNVKVRMRVNGESTCSMDNFVIRPKQFTLSTAPTLDPGATPPNDSFPAGSDFTITADPSVPRGYDGTPVLDKAKITTNLPAPAGSTDSSIPLNGSLPVAAATAPAGANPKSTGTFQYEDVGTLAFAADSVTDAVFTEEVDQVTGIVNGVNHGNMQDCIMDPNNPANDTSNTISNSRYGCVIGSPPMTKGRFRPHHYVLSSVLTAACGNKFTYMDQPKLGVAISLQAMSATNVPLQRYADGYPRLSTFQITGVGGDVARLTPALPPPVWIAGEYKVSAPASAFVRLATPDSHENFSLRTNITDSEGVVITSFNGDLSYSSNIAVSAPTAVRFGRLRLANANGSELLPLPIQMQTEYWKDGVGFVVNADDNCTEIKPENVTILHQTGGITDTNMPANNFSAPPGSGSSFQFKNGKATVIMNKPVPRPGSKGSADICVDLAGPDAAGAVCSATPAGIPWLQGAWNDKPFDDDPGARATFGVFKSGPVIYLREVY